ncbi:MAG TPA: M20 family metallopeptidase [Bacillota bacterium]|jgi:amidohydrolase|nr:amidohydrolase [Fastidiosipila sp.]HPX92570.1 M20 family metallopeptidase [Bacillota bacterium]HQB81162.1 M20 family metallopeptidase [Bacillota bacterium]
MKSLFRQAEEGLPSFIQILERLHRRPELSFHEFETTRFLAEKVKSLGLEIVDLGMETGLVGLLRGSGQGRITAIRADMDAIAVPEAEDHPVRSEMDGVMHACGHDFHMTCALGAASLLSNQKEQLAGDVVFIFQPAEEVTRGAARMLEHGLLDKLPGQVDALFGLHAEPRLPTGQVISSQGFASASKTNFRIRLRGTSGHGGAPQTYKDVIVAGAAMVNALQTIVSRRSDPQKELVCAILTVKAGETEYFVTDTMEMTGTIRAFDEAVASRAEEDLVDIAGKTAAAHGCSCQIEIIREVSSQLNHPSLFPVAAAACHKVFGEANTLTRGPLFMGAEDFSVFGQVIPSHFYWIGTGFPDRENAYQHEADFQIDPAAIPYGVALLAESVLGAMALSDGRKCP